MFIQRGEVDTSHPLTVVPNLLGHRNQHRARPTMFPGWTINRPATDLHSFLAHCDYSKYWRESKSSWCSKKGRNGKVVRRQWFFSLKRAESIAYSLGSTIRVTAGAGVNRVLVKLVSLWNYSSCKPVDTFSPFHPLADFLNHNSLLSKVMSHVLNSSFLFIPTKSESLSFTLKKSQF